MADKPINLNQARKARDRDKAKQTAAENRVKFGRTGAQRRAERLTDEKQQRDLDGHTREDN